MLLLLKYLSESNIVIKIVKAIRMKFNFNKS
jgi:hypothetical protein